MNLSRERIESIRQKAKAKALLDLGEVADLIGHNEHLTELCEARARLLLAADSEIEGLRDHKQHLVDLRETHGFDSWSAALVEVDRLKAENETIRTEAKRQEDGLREMLRRQNKQICALKGKRYD
ncbi:hypothetical protein NPS58_03915 [Pseudomonas putida]|uniref:hypothetical protein n=1 Tax=Pseudomonas putida TaxID=303 RepID=UPI0023639820|nr:hypothetical protein [Pseudomonas putida]MDD2056592.1 hypothetical protein [Pseudomonas putida]